VKHTLRSSCRWLKAKYMEVRYGWWYFFFAREQSARELRRTLQGRECEDLSLFPVK
jgi:hypothetical protein